MGVFIQPKARPKLSNVLMKTAILIGLFALMIPIAFADFPGQTSFNVSKDNIDYSSLLFYDDFIDTEGNESLNTSRWNLEYGSTRISSVTGTDSSPGQSYLNFKNSDGASPGTGMIASSLDVHADTCIDIRVAINGTASAGSETRAGIGVFGGESLANKNFYWDYTQINILQGEASFIQDTGHDWNLTHNSSNELSWMNVTIVLNESSSIQLYLNNSPTGGYLGDSLAYSVSGEYMITTRDATPYLYDWFYVYNCSGTQGFPTLGAISADNEITFTARDNYDGISISNFSVTIQYSNSSETNTYYNKTTIGSIVYNNLSFDILYNITFNSTQDGGYFNATYVDVNLSDVSTKGNLSQSYLSLNVTDLVSGSGLSSFTVKDNYSTYTGTDGYILLPSKKGHQHFNISSTQYPTQDFTYDISAMENLSFRVNVSPQFQFYLRREADNTIFDVNKTNTTKLTIFCPNENKIIYFKNGSKISTQENITMDCAYTLMKMDVTYPDSSYFRSLIPEQTQQNVTWWLLDLNQDTGVQIILQLIDLTGEFTNGQIKLKSAIGSNNEIIIEQSFDIEASVTLYLLKDAFYTVSIINNEGTEERELGTLIADTAGTKTITFPEIDFYPSKILYDNLSIEYTFNITQSILRLQYDDSTSETSYISWKIYNGSNTSQLLQTFTSTNPAASVTFTYNNIVGNTTYMAQLFIEHALLDFNITETEIFGEYTDYLFPTDGWLPDEAKNIKKYSAILFLVVWGLLFSSKHAALGVTSTFIWMLLLSWMGWFVIPYLWLGLCGLVVAITWIVEGMKK